MIACESPDWTCGIGRDRTNPSSCDQSDAPLLATPEFFDELIRLEMSHQRQPPAGNVSQDSGNLDEFFDYDEYANGGSHVDYSFAAFPGNDNSTGNTPYTGDFTSGPVTPSSYYSNITPTATTNTSTWPPLDHTDMPAFQSTSF